MPLRKLAASCRAHKHIGELVQTSQARIILSTSYLEVGLALSCNSCNTACSILKAFIGIDNSPTSSTHIVHSNCKITAKRAGVEARAAAGRRGRAASKAADITNTEKPSRFSGRSLEVVAALGRADDGDVEDIGALEAARVDLESVRLVAEGESPPDRSELPGTVRADSLTARAKEQLHLA